MENEFLKHEENIAKILNRVVSLCKQTGLIELANKGEEVLNNYNKVKELQ
jgi:hypothetical protein